MGFLLVLSVGGTAGATYLTNGSFESGDFSYWNIETSASDFSINAGYVPYDNHLVFNHSGVEQNGRINQAFYVNDNPAGLKVSFDWRGNFGESGNGDPWYDAAFNPIDPESYFRSMVFLDYADSTVGLEPKFKVLHTNMSTGWTHVEFDAYFTLPLENTDPNAKLRFLFYEREDWISNMKLDNVQVDRIPEPATMLLLGLGLIGITRFRRKFKG